MNMRHFLFMKRWAQNPPSWKRVKFIFGIILVCALLFAYEHFFGWPDSLTLDNAGGRQWFKFSF